MENRHNEHNEQNEPFIDITLGGETFRMKPENSSLFTFMGRLAMYDHVFLTTNPDEGVGTYIFASFNEAYQPLAEAMIDQEFPAHINLTDVADCDKSAFENMLRHSLEDVSDFVPDEWEASDGSQE